MFDYYLVGFSMLRSISKMPFLSWNLRIGTLAGINSMSHRIEFLQIVGMEVLNWIFILLTSYVWAVYNIYYSTYEILNFVDLPAVFSENFTHKIQLLFSIRRWSTVGEQTHVNITVVSTEPVKCWTEHEESAVELHHDSAVDLLPELNLVPHSAQALLRFTILVENWQCQRFPFRSSWSKNLVWHAAQLNISKYKWAVLMYV